MSGAPGTSLLIFSLQMAAMMVCAVGGALAAGRKRLDMVGVVFVSFGAAAGFFGPLGTTAPTQLGFWPRRSGALQKVRDFNKAAIKAALHGPKQRMVQRSIGRWGPSPLPGEWFEDSTKVEAELKPGFGFRKS